jgi:hypothetical protein
VPWIFERVANHRDEGGYCRGSKNEEENSRHDLYV